MRKIKELGPMKESIGKKMLFSKFFKTFLCIGLIVAIISLCWDLYKYFALNSVSLKRIIEDVILVGFFYVIFKTIVEESPAFLSFVRSKVGNVISWLIIFAMTLSSFEFPFNIVFSVFLLCLLALHYSIRYLGKRKHSNSL